MAKGQYIGVGGVARYVKQPYIGVGNVARKVKSGYIGVGNVARDCLSKGTPIGELEVGTSIYMNVDGVLTEFLVVHQGNPDTTLYDSSCDGTWLLMKDVYTKSAINSASNNYNNYENSTVHNYLNNTFIGLLDSDIQSAIKQVKIPYTYGYHSYSYIKSGSDGLPAKVFLLSAYELGWTTSNDSRIPIDGACLEYFENLPATDTMRISYYNGTVSYWWLRSEYTYDGWLLWLVAQDGSCTYANSTTSFGVRPAFILPSEILVDGDFNVIIENTDEPEIPEEPETNTTKINLSRFGYITEHTYEGDVSVTWGYNSDAPSGKGILYFNGNEIVNYGVDDIAGISASNDYFVDGANDIPFDTVATLKAGYTYDFYLFFNYEIGTGADTEEQGGGIDGTVIKGGDINDTTQKTTVNIHSSWTNFTYECDGDVVVEWGYDNEAGGAGELWFNDNRVYKGGIYTLAGLSASDDGSVTGANDIPAGRSAILKAGCTYDFYLYGEQESKPTIGEMGGAIDGTVTLTDNHLHYYETTSNGNNTHTTSCSCGKSFTSDCVDSYGWGSCSTCWGSITEEPSGGGESGTCSHTNVSYSSSGWMSEYNGYTHTATCNSCGASWTERCGSDGGGSCPKCIGSENWN